MFKSMLESGMMEGETGVVSVTDMQPDVFQALLHFIYSDDLPEDLQVRVVDDLPMLLFAVSLTRPGCTRF